MTVGVVVLLVLGALERRPGSPTPEELITRANRIAAAKQHHNDAAVLFNSAVQDFPRSLLRVRSVDYLND